MITLLRILMIPVLVVFFYLPYTWSNIACVIIFALAGATDWLDGYIARTMNSHSNFGAFLDPVADKLMVATSLVLLTQLHSRDYTATSILFTISAAVIIGREISISALREWLAKMGESSRLKVSPIGKLKTGFQMTAIGFLLYREPLWIINVSLIGELLLYIAAILTIWSMVNYIRAAWPAMRDTDSDVGVDADTISSSLSEKNEN